MPPSVIHKAALLAAFNSKGRASGKATVDYALRKHVKKPKGAPPGVVTIKNPQDYCSGTSGKMTFNLSEQLPKSLDIKFILVTLR